MITREQVFHTLKHKVLNQFTAADVDSITESSKLKSYVDPQLYNNLAILLKRIFTSLPSTNLGKTISEEVSTIKDLLNLIMKYTPVKISEELLP